MIDDYCYRVNGRSTNVLRNKRNITNQELLDAAERELVSLRLLEILTDHPIKGNFDFDHLKSINKYIFQDLYDWAGKTRNCDIEKENSHFCPVLNIESYAKFIFDDLKNNNYYIDMDDDTKIFKIAYLFDDINALHPFREGNGRTQREFVEDLAKINGLDIDITSIPRDEMIKACILGGYGDSSMLVDLFKKNVTKLSDYEQLHYIDTYCSKSLGKHLKSSLDNCKVR